MNETRGLWRGKVKDDMFPTHNGEWVEGYYNGLFTHQIRHVVDKIYYDVIPSTLGECTGLTDRNGKLIFEGDICAVASPNIADDEYGVIKYDHDEAAFVIEFDGFTISFVVNINSSSVEIIGNIHDSPELLKGENDVP